MSVLEYDDDATKKLLAIYTTPDIVAQREEFLKKFNVQKGERILDIGAGPGFLVERISQLVGSSGSVCGVDISEPLLKIAQTRKNEYNNIEFKKGDATKLPYNDNEFDSVVSTQVLEYIPEVDSALREFYRVVRPGGRIAILDTDWDSIVWHSPDNQLMNRILKVWEEHAADPFLPQTLEKKISKAGFINDDREIIPIFNHEFKTETYSNRMIDLIASFVADRSGVSKAETDYWAEKLRGFGRNGNYFFSLNRYYFLARKPK